MTLCFRATASHKPDLLLFSCVATQAFILLNPLDKSFSRTWSNCGFCKLISLIIKPKSCLSTKCSLKQRIGNFHGNFCYVLILNTVLNRVLCSGLETNCVIRGGQGFSISLFVFTTLYKISTRQQHAYWEIICQGMVLSYNNLTPTVFIILWCGCKNSQLWT